MILLYVRTAGIPRGKVAARVHTRLHVDLEADAIESLMMQESLVMRATT